MSLNLRQTYIASAIGIAIEDGTPITVESLAPLLPSDFCLEQRDIDEQPAPIMGEHAASEQLDDGDFTEPPVVDVHPSHVFEPQAEDEMKDIEGHKPLMVDPELASVPPDVRLVQAQDALSQARANVITCQWREQEANAVLARAITTFQSGFAPVTHERLAREHIASELEQRRLVAAGVIPPPPPQKTGNSEVDRQRAFARSSGTGSGWRNSGRAVVAGQRVYPLRGARVPGGR
jgi:hypothetical protein